VRQGSWTSHIGQSWAWNRCGPLHIRFLVFQTISLLIGPWPTTRLKDGSSGSYSRPWLQTTLAISLTMLEPSGQSIISTRRSSQRPYPSQLSGLKSSSCMQPIPVSIYRKQDFILFAPFSIENLDPNLNSYRCRSRELISTGREKALQEAS